MVYFVIFVALQSYYVCIHNMEKSSVNIQLNISLCVPQNESHTVQVWNDMWVSKLWQTFNIWENSSFK